MHLEAGKYYKDVNGDKIYIGYIMDGLAFGHWVQGNGAVLVKYKLDGCGITFRCDIISEWEEPKPPVVVDMWFNIDEDGCVESFSDKFSADSWHNKDFLETVHIRYDSSKPKGKRITEIED